MAGEDRISSLPDHLLLDIISRIKIMGKGRKQEERLMSTKEVIKATTLISKRWRHLWTLLPTLVFIDDDFKIDRLNGYDDYFTKYILCIDKALTKCRPTDLNLKKFKLDVDQTGLQVNRLIRYAITRSVQDIDLRLWDDHSCDDQLFFNNSCLVSMKLSHCIFTPPNGTIHWDKLKFLRIDDGKLDEDLIGKILFGSPCLETLELNNCFLAEHIPMSLFGNFGVLERLSCDLEAYASFRLDDELFLDFSYPFMSLKLLRCVFNPPTGAISCDKLKFLCIHQDEIDEDYFECILSGSPFLETFQLEYCYGYSRIDVTSKSVKNLVLSGYSYPLTGDYINTLKINAPYISSLTIEGKICLEKLLLENVSSLVKADLKFWVEERFMRELGRDKDVVEEELLQGLLSSLGHVNEIAQSHVGLMS